MEAFETWLHREPFRNPRPRSRSAARPRARKRDNPELRVLASTRALGWARSLFNIRIEDRLIREKHRTCPISVGLLEVPRQAPGIGEGHLEFERRLDVMVPAGVHD